MALSMKPRGLPSNGGGHSEQDAPAAAPGAVLRDCLARASGELSRLYARRKALVLELHEVNEQIADLSTIEMASVARPVRERRDVAAETCKPEESSE